MDGGASSKQARANQSSVLGRMNNKAKEKLKEHHLRGCEQDAA